MNNRKILIGKIIQEEVFKMNISLNELSDILFLNEKILLMIFKYKNIDLDLLYRFSVVVGIDFFSVYTHYLILEQSLFKTTNDSNFLIDCKKE